MGGPAVRSQLAQPRVFFHLSPAVTVQVQNGLRGGFDPKWGLAKRAEKEQSQGIQDELEGAQ